MKFSVASAFILLATLLPLHAQQQDHYPGAHAFLGLDQEAEALNFTKIKRDIGYPLVSLKSERVLKVHCRVLVDHKGKYIRHIFTRVDHPELVGPVSVHIPNLKFLPATKDHEEVSSWVNVPFEFSSKPSASVVRETIQIRKVFDFRGRKQCEESLLTTLIESESNEDWIETTGIATQLIHRSRKRLRKSNPVLLAELYRARALALLKLGLVNEAHVDLNEGLALVDQMEDQYLETRLRAMRVISWMAIGSPVNQVEDFHFLSEEWQKELVWDSWVNLMESSILRRELDFSIVLSEETELPSLLVNMLSGLDKMAQHDFELALPPLQHARLDCRQGTWQRELDLRIAECMRHLGQIEEAINLCQSVMEASPLDPFPHFVKGVLLLDAGAPDAGTKSLQQAIALGLEGQDKIQAIIWIDHSRQQQQSLGAISERH